MLLRHGLAGLAGGNPFNVYAANGFTPPLVADFSKDTEFYGYDSAASTFSDMMTVSTTGLETMTDSDGLVKWNAHNYQPNSEDFTQASWTKSQSSFSGDTLTTTAVTGDPYLYENLNGAIAPADGDKVRASYEVERGNWDYITFTFYAGAGNWTAQVFDLSDGTKGQTAESGGSNNLVSSSITDVGGGRFALTVETETKSDFGNGLILSFAPAKTGNSFTTIGTIDATWAGTETVKVYKAWANRLDLGGMVNNSDQTAAGLLSYVPTTASAVFLPRRNAHLYDASVAKWNAHNYVVQSEDATAWTKSSGTLDTAVADPDGGTSAFSLTGTADNTDCKLSIVTAAPTAVQKTFKVKAKTLGGSGWCFVGLLNPATIVHADLANGVLGTIGANVSNETITSIGGGWYQIEFDVSAITNQSAVLETVEADGATIADIGDSIAFYQPHAYRSDLNGVVANGDDGTYVATTGTEVPATLNTVSFPKKGLRWESSAATNLIDYSNEFIAGGWSIGNTDSLTLTAASAVGADGESSLTKMAITDTANEFHGLYKSITTTTSTTYCTSTDLKNEDQRYVTIRHYRGTSNWSTLVVDLQTGTITQSSTSGGGTIVFSDIEDLGGGLYRAHFASSEAGTTLFVSIDTCSSGTPTLEASDGAEVYAGTGGEAFYIGAVQTVLGSSPSSYIPTNGATVTRALETISIAGAKTPYSASGNTVQISGLQTYADNGEGWGPWTWESDTNNRTSVSVLTDATRTGLIACQTVVGNVPQAEPFTANNYFSPGLNVPFNIASVFAPNRFRCAEGGSLFGSEDTSGTIPDLSSAVFTLGAPAFAVLNFYGDQGFNGFLSQAIMWGADIGDTGLEEATA